ncbi:MAG: Obg family GTPase CgtA, partial [Actinomycetota bacterium]
SAYRPDLMDRPSLVVGAKGDQLTADDWGDEAPVDMTISSITGEGIQPLIWRMAQLVGEARQSEPLIRERHVIHRPEAVGVAVVRDHDGTWVVHSSEAERAVALSDMTDPGALDYARNRLDRLGVNKALRKAGVTDGDVVRIGEFAFDYEEDL